MRRRVGRGDSVLVWRADRSIAPIDLTRRRRRITAKVDPRRRVGHVASLIPRAGGAVLRHWEVTTGLVVIKPVVSRLRARFGPWRVEPERVQVGRCAGRTRRGRRGQMVRSDLRQDGAVIGLDGAAPVRRPGFGRRPRAGPRTAAVAAAGREHIAEIDRQLELRRCASVCLLCGGRRLGRGGGRGTHRRRSDSGTGPVRVGHRLYIPVPVRMSVLRLRRFARRAGGGQIMSVWSRRRAGIVGPFLVLECLEDCVLKVHPPRYPCCAPNGLLGGDLPTKLGGPLIDREQ